MSQLATLLNTMLTLGLFVLASLAMVGSLWIVIHFLCRESSRPFHPTDDLLGDCPDVPRLTAPADYVECAHARKDAR